MHWIDNYKSVTGVEINVSRTKLRPRFLFSSRPRVRGQSSRTQSLKPIEVSIFTRKTETKHCANLARWRRARQQRTFELQQKAGAVVRRQKLNANAMRPRRVDVTFAARRATDSISGSAADGRATSGERLVDKRVPARTERPALRQQTLTTWRWRSIYDSQDFKQGTRGHQTSPQFCPPRWVTLNILRISHAPCPLWANMTSSTKPEVAYIT